MLSDHRAAIHFNIFHIIFPYQHYTLIYGLILASSPTQISSCFILISLSQCWGWSGIISPVRAAAILPQLRGQTGSGSNLTNISLQPLITRHQVNICTGNISPWTGIRQRWLHHWRSEREGEVEIREDGPCQSSYSIVVQPAWPRDLISGIIVV